MKKVFNRKRFIYFLISLVVVYLVVWVQVFHRPTRIDGTDLDDYHNDFLPDSGKKGTAKRRVPCRCQSKSQQKHQRHQDAEDDDDDDDDDEDDESRPDDTEKDADKVDTGPRYDHIRAKPFNQKEAKMVIILAYQRVGSSFFGKIFDLNPDIFYVYEPLDALYQARYGTTSGFNIPSDITAHRNGSDRMIPRDDVTSVSGFLEDLLQCRLSRLPTEFFVHSFWSFLATFMPSWEPYLKCLEEAELTRGRRKCADQLRCPNRFGAQPWHSEQCKAKLSASPGSAEYSSARPYKECMTKVREKASKCIALMENKCRNTTFRATKIVRGTMESVEALLINNPNLRVIHLLRDPRPVAVSRMITGTYQGLYARNNSVRESRLYCSIVLRDLTLRKQLEATYPGSFFEVIYEDFVKSPAEYAKAVYRFLDMNLPESLVTWLAEKTKGGENPAQKIRRPPRWKRTLTVLEAESIYSICQDFYKTVKYDF